MKIKVRRKIAHGLVVGLQVGAMGSLVAESGLDTLNAFVADDPPLHAGTLELAQAAKPPADQDVEGGDPTGGDPSGVLKGGDPSGLFIPRPQELPVEERALSREPVDEPPDDS